MSDVCGECWVCGTLLVICPSCKIYKTPATNVFYSMKNSGCHGFRCVVGK